MSAVTLPPPVAAVERGSLRWVAQTLRRGVSLTPEIKDGIVVTLVLLVVGTAGQAVIPITIKRVIDLIASAEAGQIDLDAILSIAWATVAAVVVTGAAQVATSWRLATATERALHLLRLRVLSHVHKLSIAQIQRRRKGQLVTVITSDIEAVSQFFQWAGVELLLNLGKVVIVAVVMTVLSWQLALVVFAAVVPFLLLGAVLQRIMVSAFLRTADLLGDMVATMSESVLGITVIRAFGAEEHEADRLDTAVQNHRRSATRAGGLSAMFSGMTETAIGLITALVIFVGVLLAARGIVSPGTVAAYPGLVFALLFPLSMLGEQVSEANRAVSGFSRVLDVIDTTPDVMDADALTTLPDGPLGFDVQGLGYAYPVRQDEQAPVVDENGDSTGDALRAVDLHIPALKTTAVVGETGSGKTTLAKLITRLMDPTRGQILLGDVPLTAVGAEDLRGRVLMVPQDDTLIGGTIASNVQFARPDLTEEEIASAFDELGLTPWLARLPQGLATEVGERGGNLSVGERQLVALARAHVTSPDVLVLDEATSSVDPELDAILGRALTKVGEGRTMVVIAHRLASAERADQVAVFDRGQLVGVGTHAELVESNPVYQRLHAAWTAGT